MTQLVTAAQMRAIEAAVTAAAIASGTVTGLELMERAGRAVHPLPKADLTVTFGFLKRGHVLGWMFWRGSSPGFWRADLCLLTPPALRHGCMSAARALSGRD